MEKIKKEKNSADHLLYVSLKYTKTCDVILNLLNRWQVMLDGCIDLILKQLKKEKKISSIPLAPKLKTDILLENFKNQEIEEMVELYKFFKRVDKLEKVREGEFRKNVALKVLDRGQWLTIDLEKLRLWNESLERFLSWLHHYSK